MYRLAFGNGPSNCSTFQSKDIPNTAIHVGDTFCPTMAHFHRRVHHTPSADVLNESWDWYAAWRDLRLEWKGRPEEGKIHGIAVDELFPNMENVGSLLSEMGNVDWWCDSAQIPRPQWLLAINPGNPSAIDYVLVEINKAYPGRVWWFVESYIGCYKGALEDFGSTNAEILLDRVVKAGLHDRAIYGINHSHYVPSGQSAHCDYYNVYGTDLEHRNQDILDRVTAFVGHVVQHGPPFGFGVWTPGYSSPLSRADIDALLTANGA